MSDVLLSITPGKTLYKNNIKEEPVLFSEGVLEV